MIATNRVKKSLLGTLALVAVSLVIPDYAAAHCDTLDGPVIQDAQKAIAAQDVTPVLKWIKPQEEKAVSAAFKKMLTDRAKNPEAAEHKFFESLVKIHRAGEGAPFAGLKAAGDVEPGVAAADQALASGSAADLIKLITDDVAAGIKARFEHAAETYKHKDESVAQGREFVAAYVEYTHYVERLHQDATAKSAHGEAGHGDKHKKAAKHSRH